MPRNYSFRAATVSLDRSTNNPLFFSEYLEIQNVFMSDL